MRYPYRAKRFSVLQVVIVSSGEDRSCHVDDSSEVGMEGADCADQEDEEQAVRACVKA